MSTLHTVNKSPFANQTLLSCLNHAKEGDSVLMIEDGVYGALSGTQLAEIVAAHAAGLSLYVLRPDLAARGVDENRVIEGVEPIDYAGFVGLVAGTDRTQAWL